MTCDARLAQSYAHNPEVSLQLTLVALWSSITEPGTQDFLITSYVR